MQQFEYVSKEIPFFSPDSSKANNEEYLNPILTQMAEDGWRLHSVIKAPDYITIGQVSGPGLLAVFERPYLQRSH